METITMNVQGMTCGGCVASVTRVLKAVPGVTDVAVTLQPGTRDGDVRPGAHGSAGAARGDRGRGL